MDRKVLGATGTPYSQGLKVSGQQLIYISGQLALDENGKVVSPGDLEAQARYVFANIGKLLGEAGATYANVVKITAFISTLDGYPAYGQVRRDVFGETLPASSTVVAGLVVPGCVIEIEAVAVL